MYVSIMERKGIEKGIQIGEAKGIQIGKAETARNLLRMGLDLTKIVEATGLPLEEVCALQFQAGPMQ